LTFIKGLRQKKNDGQVQFQTLPLLPFWSYVSIFFSWNRIGDVMVSMLTSSAVDRGFEPWSGQTKDLKIGICCFSIKHAALR
jgi:hypothetical protein